ncbi:MAG: DUF4369 domain-containing protein [Bacteroidaceae bacterium]|nr:DUF4369 domain-containing protein [Bacteroidaceae bacterium]
MNRTTRVLVFLTAATLLFTSCAEKYNIIGTSMQSVYDGRMVYLNHLIDGKDASVDSCEIVHGQFNMSGSLDSVMCVTLEMGDFHLPIVLEGGDIRISSANQSIKVEGTPLNDRLYVFLTSRDSLITLLADLPRRESQMILEGYDHDDILRALGEEEAELRLSMDKLETGFITENFDNVLGVSWFMELCNNTYQRYGYPNTTPQIDDIYSRAPESFRNTPAIREYMKLCEGK